MFSYSLNHTPFYPYNLPLGNSLYMLAKLSIKLNKPIDFHLFKDSIDGKCKIIEHNNKTIIYINNKQHSLPIEKVYKHSNIYIVVTQNTIFPLSINTYCHDLNNNTDSSKIKPKTGFFKKIFRK
jgi:hypothetical protein